MTRDAARIPSIPQYTTVYQEVYPVFTALVDGEVRVKSRALPGDPERILEPWVRDEDRRELDPESERKNVGTDGGRGGGGEGGEGGRDWWIPCGPSPPPPYLHTPPPPALTPPPLRAPRGVGSVGDSQSEHDVQKPIRLTCF